MWMLIVWSDTQMNQGREKGASLMRPFSFITRPASEPDG